MAITSLTSSGIKDFFVQRVTAVIIAAYFSYILIKVLCLSFAGELNYYSWHEIFIGSAAGSFFSIATLMAFIAVFMHAWVGLWIICGDYIKITWVSTLIMLSFILSYIFCFLWLVAILFFY